MALVALFAALAASCGGPPPVEEAPPPEPRRVVLTIVGTNDLHGHVRALPYLAGYLEVLRELRRDDGAVVLLDGGDMFQGTLESNLLEGAPVVSAYAQLGYDAVAIGNHEFDYGPVGERSTATEPGDDPRGALIARATQARYPFLNANLLVRETGARVSWDGVTASTLFPKASVMIGVIGVTTEATLSTTLAANVADLSMAPLAAAIAEESAALRRRGADVVLVAAHAGGICERFEDPDDLSSCDPAQEIFAVAEALPAGAVDAIVAGHTHQAVAHRVAGIPIIESYAYGVAFGRVDLVIEDGRVVETRVFEPQRLCETGSCHEGTCALGEYEGVAVAPVAEVQAAVDPAIENASALRERSLGVQLSAAIDRTRVAECPLGNLFVDLMRASRPGVDVALTNGGGLRADLPAGALTYGQLYEAMPFDNRFAIVNVRAAELRALVEANLQDDGSFFSLSGVRAEARCDGERLAVTLSDERGRRIPDDRELRLITTDFLATGGDGLMRHVAAGEDAVTLDDGELVRDGMARVLEQRGGTLAPGDLFDPARPRVAYPGERPVRCAP